jgi:hypothetical protein
MEKQTIKATTLVMFGWGEQRDLPEPIVGGGRKVTRSRELFFWLMMGWF